MFLTTRFLRADNRWQAFGLHIVVSLLLFIVLASVIYFFWYPGFLFHYEGGLEGMKLIAGVDFFIGPVLTLMVYKVGKKSLPFDLACIAVLQVACLVGGMWTVWQTRPVAVVFAGGQYAVTNAYGYKKAQIDMEQIPLLSGRWPVWIAADVPDDKQKEFRLRWAFSGGLQYRPEMYMAYEAYVPRLTKSGMGFDEIKKIYKDRVAAFEGKPHIQFYPALTSSYDGHVAVDTTNGEVIDFFH